MDEDGRLMHHVPTLIYHIISRLGEVHLAKNNHKGPTWASRALPHRQVPPVESVYRDAIGSLVQGNLRINWLVPQRFFSTYVI
jgi:hypothetical protein